MCYNDFRIKRISALSNIFLGFLCAGGVVKSFIVGALINEFTGKMQLAIAVGVGTILYSIFIACVVSFALFKLLEMPIKINAIRGLAEDSYDILCEGCGAFMTMWERDNTNFDENNCNVHNETDENGRRIVKI